MPKFTREEANLIRRYTEQSEGSRLSFYASVLFAPIAIAVYGLFQRDYLAIAVGFFGLLAIVLWHISAERQYAKRYRSIFGKLTEADMISSEHERDA